jgi:hypothetical protein
VYSSPDTFVAGFRSALWIAVAFSAVGLLLALFRKRSTAAKLETAVALGETADHRSGQRETTAGPLAMSFDTTLDQTGLGRGMSGDDVAKTRYQKGKEDLG